MSTYFCTKRRKYLPSRYPSSLLSVPITFAMDCATESFSAITNFIFFTQILFPSFIFYLLSDSINAIMYIE